MHCRECGTELEDDAQFCANCGSRPLNARDFCQVCGASTSPDDENCPTCYQRLEYRGDSEPEGRPQREVTGAAKSPVLAALLSCLLPGIGQVYLGQVGKGLALFVANALMGMIFPLLMIVVEMLAIVDAYMIGAKLRSGRAVDKWEFF